MRKDRAGCILLDDAGKRGPLGIDAILRLGCKKVLYQLRKLKLIKFIVSG